MTARRVAAPAIILAVGCVILAINLGVRQTMGLFVEPVSLAHGWGGETFSLAIGLQNLSCLSVTLRLGRHMFLVRS